MPTKKEKAAKRLGGRLPTMDQSGLDALKKECAGESDRGAALLAAAYLEGTLEQALRRCLVRDELGDMLFDESGGPLGTLAAKLKLGRALGVIPELIFRDLELIRSIRNDFAHHPDRLTFDTPSVSSRCDATHTGIHIRTLEKASGVKDPNWSPRELYLVAVWMAICMMEVETEGRVRPKATDMYVSIPVPGYSKNLPVRDGSRPKR